MTFQWSGLCGGVSCAMLFSEETLTRLSTMQEAQQVLVS